MSYEHKAEHKVQPPGPPRRFMPFCAYCGSPNDDDVANCRSCGNAIQPRSSEVKAAQNAAADGGPAPGAFVQRVLEKARTVRTIVASRASRATSHLSHQQPAPGGLAARDASGDRALAPRQFSSRVDAHRKPDFIGTSVPFHDDHAFTSVGIDLGTTFSCVAAWIPVGDGNKGAVRIFETSEQKQTTPSVVAFNDMEALVGNKAKMQAWANAANTVFDAKRLMGKPFAQVDKVDLSHWPFHVEADAGGMPEIHVEFQSKKQTLRPEDIACEVLKDMKNTAQRKSTKPIRSAVITVPAYFDDNQRNATRRAGEMAGLEVLQIINEPTAAAIAYGCGGIDGRSNVLVFDLGGGTFDVSLLTLDDGDYRVRAVNGDPHLGGEDFDSRLVDHVIDAFERQHPGTRTAIHEDTTKKLRLRKRCEDAKIALSGKHVREWTIELSDFVGGLDLEVEITRAEFNTMCEPLFARLVGPVEQCLRDAGMPATQINDIVLVGGSTRIPKVRTLLSEFFDGKELNTSVDPDTAVAYGAAVQAAILSGDDRAGALVDVLLCDVTPLSLGIEDGEGSMHVMIPRNTQVPCIKTTEFVTTVDNQTEVTVKLCQGESKRASECVDIGTFKLEGFPRKPKGEVKVEVTFSVDMDVVLTVTAREMSEGEAKSLRVTKSGPSW